MGIGFIKPGPHATNPPVLPLPKGKLAQGQTPNFGARRRRGAYRSSTTGNQQGKSVNNSSQYRFLWEKEKRQPGVSHRQRTEQRTHPCYYNTTPSFTPWRQGCQTTAVVFSLVDAKTAAHLERNASESPPPANKSCVVYVFRHSECDTDRPTKKLRTHSESGGAATHTQQANTYKQNPNTQMVMVLGIHTP